MKTKIDYDLQYSKLGTAVMKALMNILLLLLSEKHVFIINCNVCYFNFVLAL